MKTETPPLITPDLTTNTQAYSTYIQFSTGTNTKEINGIAHHTVLPIEVE